MRYFLHLGVLIELYLMLALSLNLLVGYSGLLTLAHAAFYGLGAYLTALSMIGLGLGFFPAMLIAVAVAALLSLLVSWASLRFRGDYFVLASLAFQVIVFSVMYNWTSVTRGPFGISGIPKPRVAGVAADTLPAFFVFGLIISAAVVGFLFLVYRSPFCRTLQAIRDDELAALALGKNVTSFKVRCVAIAAAVAAAAGAMYASYVTYIDPTSFNTEESILLLSMIIVGGTGNVWGPVAGVLLLLLFPEVLKSLPVSAADAASLRMFVYGLLLVVVMRFRPQGLVGRYRFQ